MARLLLVLVVATLVSSSLQQDSRIRLVGGSGPHEGRVEIRSYGSYNWGTVCNDDFDMNDARVVCRTVGYTGASAYYGSAHYGPGSGPIYMDNLRCTGTESSLFDCPYNGWGRYDCTHQKDVGVLCSTPTSLDDEGCKTVRISGSSSVQSDRMITYTMTGELFNDRPVYRSSRAEQDFLYYYTGQGTASWHVGPGLGSDVKAMYLPNDTSIYADSTSGTWYLFDGTDFIRNSRVTVSCIDPSTVVNGQWSNWGSWATCHSYCTCGDESCVTNTVHRTRQCITPPPRNGGLYCAGDSSHSRLCACLDIDECLDNMLNNCDGDSGASCVNTPGGYSCECGDGYTIQANGRTCQGRELSTGAIVGISFGVIIPSVLMIIGIYYYKVCKRDGSAITVGSVAPVPSCPPPKY